MQWLCRHRVIDLTRPVVMGILNVTPDSFSDGGRYASPDAALDRAATMQAEGAAIVDIGGESTRPGSLGTPESVELERVIPVIERISRNLDVALSIDTCKPAVMSAALAAGACIINDIQALRARGAREIAASSAAGVCLMHMQGEPRTMQQHPVYQDVVREVGEFLSLEREACIAAGVRRESIVLDPGVGFGKGLEHNMTLLKALPQLAGYGAPLLVGVSRKSFIGRILGRDTHERLYGGLGLASLAVTLGASIIRTHDVGPTVDAVRMVSAVMTS